MGLPHFHSHKIQSVEPAYINSYEISLITRSGDTKMPHLDRYEIIDNTITCKFQFQNKSELDYGDIKNTDILIISHYNKMGNIIRFDILQVNNTLFKTTPFSCEEMYAGDNVSYIDCKFSIQNTNTISEEDINTGSSAQILESVMNSYKRDIKLNSVLE